LSFDVEGNIPTSAQFFDNVKLVKGDCMSRFFGVVVFFIFVAIVAPLYLTVGVAMVVAFAVWASLGHDSRCHGCEDCLGEVAMGGSAQVDFSQAVIVDHPVSIAA